MQRRVQEEPAGAMRPHSSGMWVPSPQRKPEWPYRKVVWCLRMENTLGMRAVPLYLSVAALTWSRAVPPHSLTAQRRRCPCRGAGNQVHRAGVGCQGRAEAWVGCVQAGLHVAPRFFFGRVVAFAPRCTQLCFQPPAGFCTSVSAWQPGCVPPSPV